VILAVLSICGGGGNKSTLTVCEVAGQ